MPELPEVETVRRGLAPVLEGRVLARVEVRRKDLRIPFPPRFAERLTGRRVTRLDRRAKYLLAHLDDGMVLVIHLGMSGRVFILPPEGGKRRATAQFHHEAGTGAHDHVLILTDQGHTLVYNDHRRFGLMTLVSGNELPDHAFFAKMGPEPLGAALDMDLLVQAFAGKRSPVKAALLDQHVVAGLGNIYVCEALWRAKISPERLAGEVTKAEIKRLVPAIKQVLEEAIVAGGSTLRDFAHTDGELGYFQTRFAVYDRADEPCPRPTCRGTEIRRIVQSNRSSFFCPRCQK